ncbi:MAG: hypothetical protein DRP64_07895 [Verrucomicrobia bacterium]|nr:MAG: hypothetical protein DRP64_07895 [Verrucomicrobiota bacterium]
MIFCAGLLVMLNGTATAADGAWTGSGSDNLWTTAANWNVVPGAGNIATVDTTLNNPLVNMDVSDVYNTIYIGKSNTDEVTLTVQNGGYLRQSTSAMFISMGHDSGSKARLDMTGGTISGRDMIVGQYGSADVNVSGGTISMARNFYVGDRDGTAASTVDISGGTVDVGGWTGVGVQSGGMQTMTVSGSGYLETGNLSLGLNDGQGTLNISGGGNVNLVAAGSRLRVGEGFQGAGATGTINMNGGTLDVDSYIALGFTAGSSGSMDMTAGDVFVNAFVVGLNGDGDFTMTGGNLGLDSHVRVGEGGGQGTWNMAGGLVEAPNYVSVGWGTSIGDTDLLDMTAGEIQTGDLEIGRYGDGRVDLSGGTININYHDAGNGLLFDTNGGNGKLNVAGGTLNWLHGNYTNEVNAFVTSGDIVAYNGTKAVSVVYDSGSNTTVVAADSTTPVDSTWIGNGGDDLWTTSGNWDTPPTAAGNAIIDATGNDPLVNMDLADTYIDVSLGVDSSALVGLTLQSGGHLRSSSDVFVGQTAGSNGRIDMSGGTLTGNDMRVGAAGTGVFEMTGGTVDMNNNLIMGQTDGHGVGEFNVSGGAVDFGSWMGVAYQSGGTNTLNLSGTGYIECTKLSLGLNDGDGVVNISGSGHLKLRSGDSRLRIAEGSAATGVLNMDGGLIEAEDYISIGHTAGGVGTMNMTNGTVRMGAFVVGLNGDGDFNMTGGHIVASSHVRVGEGGGQGTWNMDGGLVEATNYMAVGWGTSAGETDLLDMTAGELQTGDLRIGLFGDGKVDLIGGTINVNYYDDGDGLLFDSNGGDGTLNMAGGTLNWMYGNYTTHIEALVLSGDIVAYDGAGEVSVAYSAGTDTTIVQADVSPFELWMLAEYGLSGDDAAATNDYDGDGFDNLYEYGLGGDPTNPSDIGIVPMYGAREDGGANWFEYVYPKRSDANSGISYHLELTDDLIYTPWANSGYSIAGTGTIDSEFDAVTNRISTEIEDEQFIRLVIEEL